MQRELKREEATVDDCAENNTLPALCLEEDNKKAYDSSRWRQVYKFSTSFTLFHVAFPRLDFAIQSATGRFDDCLDPPLRSKRQHETIHVWRMLDSKNSRLNVLCRGPTLAIKVVRVDEARNDRYPSFMLQI